MGSIPITRSRWASESRDLHEPVQSGWPHAGYGDPRQFDELSAHVAQSVEHVLGKDEVTGSIPVVGSTRAGRVDVGLGSGKIRNRLQAARGARRQVFEETRHVEREV